MWIVVAVLCYMYFHVSEHSYVSCLSVAYAAQSMIPDMGTLSRETQSSGELEQNLIVTIQEVVIGVAILTVVDLLAASKASKQARQRLQISFRRARELAELLGDAAGSAASTELCIKRFADFLGDLDALRGLIPHAAKEPVYGGEPFKTELYEELEARLRAVAGHVADIEWAARIRSHRRAAPAAQAGPASWPCRGDESSPVAMDAAQLAPNQALDDALRLLFSRLRRNVDGMLRGVEALAAFVTQHGQSFPAPAQPWSSRAAERGGRGAGAPQSLEAILTEPQGGGHPVRRRLTRLLSQVLEDEDAPAAQAHGLSASVASRGAALETLFVGLRFQLAASDANLPHHDDLCRFEVVLLLTRLLVGEVRKMELALMEY
ncbi:unnamed protein product [Prorocentrum cordatum]|uniref:Uncharacterized protein n=1 Tax=Prorocentrum cordatum TaxID=2364126 RepID=A0ABN9XML3_9DINO|nr:unnamed protein product [Polarella glacialis]